MASIEKKYVWLDPGFLAALQAKRLECKQAQMKPEGEHWSRRRGEGFTFADYKEYTIGDDVRFIDWSKSAQSGRWYVKQFETEVNRPTHIILDQSGSMAVPKEDEKGIYAINVAMALAYVAIVRRDPVICSLLIDSGASNVTACPPCRSVHDFHTLTRYVAERARAPRGHVLLPAAIAHCLAGPSRKGLTILISDFLFDLREIYLALMTLLQSGNDVIAIRISGPREESLLPSRKTVRAVDAETGETVDVDFDAQKYADQMGHHINRLRRWCQYRGVKFIRARTDEPVQRFVLVRLVAEGLIR
jgi:uncharacterized protein (DUF58 family)